MFFIKPPLLWLSVFIAVLFSCSRTPEYLESKSIEPITVPKTVDKQRLSELYPVPEQTRLAPSEFSLPFPPMIGAQDSSNIASVQVLNGVTWVLNAKSPATTWSQVLGILQSKGYSIAVQDLKNTFIETGWSTQAVQPGFVIRYRFRFERGFQPNTTEIYLFNEKARASEVGFLSKQWPDQLQDNVHRDLLVNDMVAVLNNPENVTGDSFLASTIELPDKLTLTSLNKEPVLLANVSQKRLKASLENALSSNGLLIYDQSSDHSVFHFDTYKAETKKSGWFNAVSLSSKGSNKTSKYPLEMILNHLPNDPKVNELFPNAPNRESDKSLSDIPGYLLVQLSIKDQLYIFIRDGYGKPLKLDKSQELLDLIKLRLI